MWKSILLILLSISTCAQARDVWSPEKANEWFKKQPYRAGVNYVPSYAINSIEFWQNESFNIDVIEKELALMSSVGFNAVRIFLSDIVWKYQEREAMKNLESFLRAADKYGIGSMIVFFTNGGKLGAKLGKQPEPAGLHNSGWFKTPDMDIFRDKSKWGYLERYVKVVVSKYADDPRVICWDVYNEPGGIMSKHIVGATEGLSKDDIQILENLCVDFLKESAKWARECNPSQPITFGVYRPDDDRIGMILNKIQYSESDVISYHSYSPLLSQIQQVKKLKKYGRPIMCTEWMGRNHGSTFMPILGYLKDNNVWSFSFGLVAGKIEAYLPWPNSIKLGDDSGIWFHDIFYPDHTPYCPEEVEYIKRILGKK